LRELLAQRELGGVPLPGNKTVEDLLIESTVKHAIKGSPGHLQQIWDRLEGKTPTAVEISGPDGGSVNVSGLMAKIMVALAEHPAARIAVAAALHQAGGEKAEGEPEVIDVEPVDAPKTDNEHD
jgi:hypothetical protein